jgi:gas vesicle protein
MSTGKVILGALAGLAVGAIAGILFAPEKGSTTRRQIMDKGDDYVEKLKSKYEKVRDSVADKFESTLDEAENLANRGRAKYNDVRKDVRNAAENIRNDVAADMNNGTS